MTDVSVMVLEDDEEVRNHLSSSLRTKTGFNLLASTDNLREAKNLLKELKPDVLLVDLGLPDGDGIDIIRCIYDYQIHTKAIVISGFSDEKKVFNALKAGAQGYILKYEGQYDICSAIQQMLDGGAPISPSIARLMLTAFNPKKPAPEELTEVLTSRQENILLHISQGFSSQEIAEKLTISYHTVTTHHKEYL